MNYAYATFMQYSTFIGYVNDAQAGTPISRAVLTMNQSGILYTITTGAAGNYSTSGTSFVTGIPLQINTTATGYFPYNATITPISETTALLNISMVNITPTVTGRGIGGVYREGVVTYGINTGGYGNPISSGTIRVTNTTTGESYTAVTSMTGWYLCDEGSSCYLTAQRPYIVNGQKLGYLASPNYTVVAA
jgi:hypothetical protein